MLYLTLFSHYHQNFIFVHSNIACHMLCSVGDFIDTGIDDQMAAMQDSTLENFDEDFDEDDMDQDDIQK